MPGLKGPTANRVPEGSANCMTDLEQRGVHEQRQKGGDHADPEKIPGDFQYGDGRLQKRSEIGLSEGVIPYSPGSDEYLAWNDGWKYPFEQNGIQLLPDVRLRGPSQQRGAECIGAQMHRAVRSARAP